MRFVLGKAGYFVAKAALHCGIAQALGQIPTLLQHLDCARYVALADKGSDFTEQAGVAFSFGGGVHLRI